MFPNEAVAVAATRDDSGSAAVSDSVADSVAGSDADAGSDPDTASVDLAGLPVAVLGWAGSTERQLRPVTRLWRARGAAPFTARAQVFRAMARPDGWALEGASLAARIRVRLRRGARGFGVHLFSNAGFWTWAAALRELSEAERARVRWVIVDSAPGFPRHIDPRFYADHASRAMMPMVLRALGRPPALRHPWLTPPVWAFMRGWYHASLPQQREAGASLEVVAEGSAPMMFLYSAADQLVPARYVEGFVASLERPVTVERFEDSPHVAHLIHHRRRYHAAVDRFLDETGDASPR